MREFMTKVSDYWDERKNNPDRQENQLAVVVTGAAAVVIIVLLIVLLWGYVKGREGEVSSESAQREQEIRVEDDDTDREDLSKAVHEEEAVKYMSEDSGEKLRQEYLTSTAYLREKVDELLEMMTQVQEGLHEVEKEYQDADAAMKTQITTLCREIETIVNNLKDTQVKLTDLTDIVQVIDKEKIPLIQQQIEMIRGDMGQVQADILGLHEKMAALKKEDERLWASISDLEKSVREALNQNVAEVNHRLDQLQAGMDHLERAFEKQLQENMKDVNERIDILMGQLEGRVQNLTENTLRYRYDRETNTLYLSPMQE